MPDDQTANAVPRELIVSSFELGDDGAPTTYYRLLIGSQIKQIVVSPGTFDSETLKSPLQFLPRLPDSEKCTAATISRDKTSGDLTISFSIQKVPGIRYQWHDVLVDHRDLETEEWLYERTFKVVSHSTVLPRGSMIAKIARSESELPLTKRETRAYQLLEGEGLAPCFLAHIHKNGRTIGFLLEKTEGRPATSADRDICEAALRRLHKLGLRHGNVSRYNFLITEQGVKLHNFELSEENASFRSRCDELGCLSDEFADG